MKKTCETAALLSLVLVVGYEYTFGILGVATIDSLQV